MPSVEQERLRRDALDCEITCDARKPQARLLYEALLDARFTPFIIGGFEMKALALSCEVTTEPDPTPEEPGRERQLARFTLRLEEAT